MPSIAQTRHRRVARLWPAEWAVNRRRAPWWTLFLPRLGADRRRECHSAQRLRQAGRRRPALFTRPGVSCSSQRWRVRTDQC
jgi:hypothetical protein